MAWLCAAISPMACWMKGSSRAASAAVQGRAALAAHVVPGFPHQRAHDAGGRRHQHQLAPGGNVMAGQSQLAQGHALQFGFLDAGIVQQQAAAGRQALAEAVPVVHDLQARAVQRQDHGDGLVLLVDGGDVGVVGVQGAGRVVLAAVQAVVAVLARQPRGDEAGFGRALFRRGAAEQLAGQDAAELLPHVFVRRQHAPQRGHVVVQAQRVWHVGVGGGQRDDGLGHVLQRAVRPAMLGRHQQRARPDARTASKASKGRRRSRSRATAPASRASACPAGWRGYRRGAGGAARRPVLRAGRGAVCRRCRGHAVIPPLRRVWPVRRKARGLPPGVQDR